MWAPAARDRPAHGGAPRPARPRAGSARSEVCPHRERPRGHGHSQRRWPHTPLPAPGPLTPLAHAGDVEGAARQQRDPWGCGGQGSTPCSAPHPPASPQLSRGARPGWAVPRAVLLCSQEAGGLGATPIRQGKWATPSRSAWSDSGRRWKLDRPRRELPQSRPEPPPPSLAHVCHFWLTASPRRPATPCLRLSWAMSTLPSSIKKCLITLYSCLGERQIESRLDSLLHIHYYIHFLF